MNHIYKVIWNTITQTWVAVPNLAEQKAKQNQVKH